MAAILELRDLAKSFGPVEVLRDISLRIETGDFLVLLGPSGCGKSTLLNCIAGLEEVSRGAILIDGTDMTRRPPKERDLAMVFQSYALYPTMSVAENISFGLKVRGAAGAEQRAAAEQVARTLQIQDLLDRKPSELSGGQRQRVAIGRALVREPKLFLFDEPLSNLDAKLRVEMRAEIRHLHERVHASIVYVTHDQIEAMTMATQICVLNGGVIQQMGSPDEVYHRPANTFVAGFMGSPPMNLLEARSADGVLDLGGAGLAIQGFELPAGAVTFGIRPEDIRLGDPSGQGLLQATVLDAEHTGADGYLLCQLGEQTLTVRVDPQSGARRGDRVELEIGRENMHFFDAQSGERIG